MADRLVIDMGNTRCKLGVFKGREMIETQVFDDLDPAIILKILQKHHHPPTIYSTTRHLNDRLKTFFDQTKTIYPIRDCQPYPFAMVYDEPDTLGTDRIAGLAYARRLYAHRNCLIVSAGTCITYDLIDEKGQHLGGNISPGLQMRLHAMSAFTDKLPKLKLEQPKRKTGDSTSTAMMVGAVVGAQKEFQGFVQTYRKKLNNLNVLLTGGDRLYFVNCLKSKIFGDSYLVLRGLNEILMFYEEGRE